jgi:hypothetical protein
MFHTGVRMRLQITIEILMSMTLSLLIAASVLHTFNSAGPLMHSTQSALDIAARNANACVGSFMSH